jgi:hypothetical protein
MSETHDFAHLDHLGEGDHDDPPLTDVPPPASHTKKDLLFSSPEAIAFEKQTIAVYDNVNIIRSKVEDEVIPDVASYFPSLEDTTQIKELEQGGEYH